MELERLTNSISANLINLPADEIDEGIDYALQAIGKFNQVDRSYLFQVHKNSMTINCTHQWRALGIGPMADQPKKEFPLASAPWLVEKMQRFETIHIPNVANLPDEAEPVKKILQGQSVKSLIAVPLVYGGILKGFIGFDSMQERKVWGNECIAMLKIVGEILVNAIERGKAVRAQTQSLREKEVLLREIHHRVKNNMQVISSLLDMQSEYIKSEHYIEMFRESRNRIKSMALIHEKLYRTWDLTNIDLNDYINDLADNLFTAYGLDSAGIVLKVKAGTVSLKIDTAIPCGLIINELISNSLKYAFAGREKGEIAITLHPAGENGVELVVADNGNGLPEGLDFRNTETLGLQLVTSLAEHQLQGRVEMNRTNGTEFRITFKER